jgi:uncharacterized protein (DUF1800 family)
MHDRVTDRVNRRSVLVAVAGAGAAAAAACSRLLGGRAGPEVRQVDLTSAAPARPADAGAFANRDASYAAAGGQAAVKAAPAPVLVYPTASAAAAATKPAVPGVLANGDPVLHLLRRATIGPTPAMAADVRDRGIDAWIASQLAPDTIADAVADGAAAAFPLATADLPTVHARVHPGDWGAMWDYARYTLARMVWSDRQLYEVMVDFWANHLNVPQPGPGSWDVGPAYHRDVIRRHALGSFTDMLLAAGRHPAMLRYLSAHLSDRHSVNENYGRELLELHTVGIDGGYTEKDVRNSAYILTGRTAVDDGNPGAGTFRYDPARHWTGPVKVLDFTSPNATGAGGLAVGDAYLRHLAGLPATARTIARKLAVRFVADAPPPALIDRLAKAYLDGGTQIVPVLRLMFRSAEFWASVGQKVRRPLESLVASARALGVRPGPDTAAGVDTLLDRSNDLGHRPLAWLAPNGYPDVHAAWRSAGSVVGLWNVHRVLAAGDVAGLTVAPAAQRVAGAGGAAGGTVAAQVDGLCRSLCLQAFRPAHRDALVRFVGGPAVGDDAADLVALVLDSPYFTLR